jgi:hypothetical protein
VTFQTCADKKAGANRGGLKRVEMSWSNLFALLVICWAPILFEGRGNLPKKSQTGGWAARALFFVYLLCALFGTATVIRIVLNGN